MERVDLRTREAKAAQEYMAHKGYPKMRPVGVEKIEGQATWYFYYDLPEGRLELEVAWYDGTWHWTTTAFQDHSVPA